MLRYKLFTICDVITVYSYGAAIALGVVLFMLLIQRNPRFKQLNLEPYFSEAVLVGIAAAVIGGRLLHVISYPEEIHHIIDIIAIWRGGFSVVGSILAALTILPLYFYYRKLPMLPTLDLAALYAPLLQAVARLGCLFAGCCYGIPTNAWWAIQYRDPESMAPLSVYLHPTQLYSACLLFLIFIFLYFFAQPYCNKPGQLTSLYLMLVSSERLAVDFWRDDRLLWPVSFLSLHQLICICIIICAATFFIITLLPKRHGHI